MIHLGPSGHSLLSDSEDSPTTRSSKARFGGKGIGLVASIALTVNNISGAGMLEFPQMFQRSGILPSLLSLAFVCIVSTLFATTLADTVARIPGNKHFGIRIEFSDIFEQYIGRRIANLTQAVFYLNLLSQNIAAIVACAQMFDSFAGSFWPGVTYALRVSPSPWDWIRWDPSHCKSGSGNCVPFASETEGALIISMGYLVTLLLFAPLGLLTLEENMLQQKFSFVALFVLSGQFVYAFLSTGLDAGSLPWIGNHWADALGVVIFNFAFCVTVPSWLNEKAPDVSVNRVFWTSTLTSTLLYTCVGILGALAFPHVPENMLSVLLSQQVDFTTRFCATLFGVVIIGFGIPIFSVIMRYNLVNSGLCSEPLAHVWSSVVPWLSAWTLYQGSVTLKLLSWSGLVLNGFIDFLMPGLVTIISLGAAKRALHCWGRQSLDVEETPSLTQAMPSSPIAPFPDWLRPYYREVVTAMLAFLLVLLPLCLWLQMYCSGSKACYPVV